MTLVKDADVAIYGGPVRNELGERDCLSLTGDTFYRLLRDLRLLKK